MRPVILPPPIMPPFESDGAFASRAWSVGAASRAAINAATSASLCFGLCMRDSPFVEDLGFLWLGRRLRARSGTATARYAGQKARGRCGCGWLGRAERLRRLFRILYLPRLRCARSAAHFVHAETKAANHKTRQRGQQNRRD